MPELPDLHIFSQNLKKRILHKTIASVTVYNTRKIDCTRAQRTLGETNSLPKQPKVDTPNSFCEQLTGTSIQDIVREGKELHFLLENNNSFGVHLMLSGKFFITDKDAAEKIGSKITVLFFEDGESFIISDFQMLCKVMLNPKPSGVPDAMSDSFTFEYFLKQIQKKQRENIKAVLIDQRVVRGIGNAYVDEILWKANISPESVAGKIPEEKLKELYEAIPFILNDAIQNIMKISPDIIAGEERSFLRVHNPRKKCTDEGDKIIVKTVASKKTYFTEKQELFV